MLATTLLLPPLLGALKIFALRVCDVSIGTVRTLFSMRGSRWVAAGLGLIESGIFVTAIAGVFRQLDNYWNMAGYAGGFAVGTFLGISIEQWIGSGTIMARILTRQNPDALSADLRQRGHGVTVLSGEGKEGEVRVLLVVAPRRRANDLLAAVSAHDPQAFVTVDTLNFAAGGYIAARGAVSVRK
jgi:uncharacterized protein YebE (UPF0316 family)